MNLNIGSHTFTAADYDAEGDVLFLYNADPKLAASSNATREGDCVSYDKDGRVISVEILSARYRLEHDGGIKLTLPVREEHLNLTGGAVAQLVAA
jgi:uncharacterized protein YuzE